MANDPLSQFRKASHAPKGAMIPPTEADEYVAFGTKDKVHRLRIRSATPLVHSPGYNLLLDVVSDGQQGTHFILVYTVLLVLVQGKNLQKMVFALENGQADYIQEFDPERWKKPTDETAAFIESMEIKVTEGGSTGAGKKH
jgi:hypothetical protein